MVSDELRPFMRIFGTIWRFVRNRDSNELIILCRLMSYLYPYSGSL